MYIRDVFQEQHGQHKILVDGRINGAAKGVACTPYRLVDLVLINLCVVSHVGCSVASDQAVVCTSFWSSFARCSRS